jgi:hypothetical protein
VQGKKRAVRLAGAAVLKPQGGNCAVLPKKKGNKKSWDAVKTAPQANGVENGKISCWR